jgi:V8-like Glu-specific endopeptidase
MAVSSTTFPYDTVVYVTDTLGDETWQGSGVLIAPNEVLTAAHLVYSSSYGLASNIEVTPGYDAGVAPFGTATATSVNFMQIVDPNDTITEQQSQNDYALIRLSTSFSSIGNMVLDPNFTGGSVNVSGYPGQDGGVLDNSQQMVTLNPAYTLLDGTSIGPGSSGGPVWVVGSNGQPEVVGLVSSGEGGVGGPGFFNQITTATVDKIDAWITQDEATIATLLTVEDITTGQPVTPTAQTYAGPVSGIQQQFIDITPDNLNITATTPNWFIASGGGNDAIAVSSGTNVLDGGAGSNFLNGGIGDDTFFVDDRGAATAIWSTVNNFHSGDAATIWGITPSDFDLSWVDGQGATGYTGLTLHATAAGVPTASLTLAGFTRAALADGELTISFGTTAATNGLPGSTYMYVHAN